MNPIEFMRLKPRISHSPTIDTYELKSRMDLKMQQHRPYFIVASVEVGNTTTKCILMAVNLKEGKSYLVNKTVKMTRDVRPPKGDEEVFGYTLNRVPLTRNAVSELVRDTLLECFYSVNLDIKKDLNFVVRSTGVVAGFRTEEEIGNIIKALADGCLFAGVPPRAMTSAFSIDNIGAAFKPYSLIEKINFDGAVGGVTPPKGATGVELVANEMEGELATAGLKEGAKWAGVDYRNPCLSLDFGTTLDGRITNANLPYAKTIGNFCGLAGAIPDALVRGTKLVDGNVGVALDVINEKPAGNITLMRKSRVIEEYAERIHKYIIIETVPSGRDHYGTIPVNPEVAKVLDVTLIGCDIGHDGSDLPKLAEIGGEIYKKYDLNILSAILDVTMAKLVQRLVKLALDQHLINRDTAIGVTGRAGITCNKPKIILKYIKELGIYDNSEENVVFVDDGLARGAAVMARCMNLLGTPKTPIGGNRGGRCVLGARIKHEKELRQASQVR